MVHLLQADFATARSLALRQPRLLVNSPAALQSRFEEIRLTTGLDCAGVTDLLSRQPGLLTYLPETLSYNLESLSHLLGVSMDRATKLLIRCPSVFMLVGHSARHMSVHDGLVREARFVMNNIQAFIGQQNQISCTAAVS